MITFKNKNTNTIIPDEKNESIRRCCLRCYLKNNVVLKPYEELTLDTGLIISLTTPLEYVFTRGEENDKFIVCTDIVRFHSDRVRLGKYNKEIKIYINNKTDSELLIPEKTFYMVAYATKLIGFEVPEKETKFSKLKETDLGDGFFVFYDDKKYEAFQEPTLHKTDDIILSAGFTKNE